MGFPFFKRPRLFFKREPEIIGSDAPDAWSSGRYCNEETWQVDPQVGPELRIGGAMPLVVVGANRSGKDTGIGMVNGLRMEGALVANDPRGEWWGVCGPYRSTLHPTVPVNPHGLLTHIPGYEDAESIGWAPLDELSDDAALFDNAACYMDGLFPIRQSEDPHWSLRSREWVGGLSMDEVIGAKKAGRPALFSNVRAKISEGEEYDPATGEPIKGPFATARRLVREGHPQISDLAGGFTNDNDEARSVFATVRGRTMFMLSEAHRVDELKNGLRLSDLATKAMSISLMMPPHMVQSDSIHAPFMRMFFSAAMSALFRPTHRITTFYLNEFAALGKLQAVEAAYGLAAGFGIRLVIVVQSFTQLREIYGHAWENFVGNAAAIAVVGPPADPFTADFISKRAGEMTIIQPNASINLNPGGIGLNNGEAYTRRQYLMPHRPLQHSARLRLCVSAGIEQRNPGLLSPLF